MIESIEIKNFRGIQDGKLTGFTPLTILVGPNSSGKSTVLDALLLGVHPMPSEVLKKLVKERRATQEGKRWLFWRGRKDSSIQITVSTSDRRSRSTFVHLVPEDAKYLVYSIGFARQDTLVQTDYGTVTWSEEDTTVRQIPLIGDIANVGLIEFDTIHPQTPLHQLFSQMVDQGHRKEARAILSDAVPGLDNVEILTEGDKPIIGLVYSDHAVPSAMAGEGIQSLLRLSLELGAFSSGVVLLEEPEVHQHPGAILQSAKAIMAAVRRGIQIFVSTHSLELIDALLREVQSEEELDKIGLFRLKLDDGCLKSSHVTGPDIAFSRVEIGTDLR